MTRRALILVGLVALWAAPLSVRAIDLGGGTLKHQHNSNDSGGITISPQTIISPAGSALTIGTETDNQIRIFTDGVQRWGIDSLNGLFPGASDAYDLGAPTQIVRKVYVRTMSQQPVTFVSLLTPPNGTINYCSDCTFANPCAGGGTGAIAKRLNGAWRCD